MLRESKLLLNNNSNAEAKNFEDLKLYNETTEIIPLEKALAWALLAHIILSLLICVVPTILLFLGFDLSLFKKPTPKIKDIEFVIVNQPEETPINKDTPLRADRNTRAGGIHDPNKRIAPPQPALPTPAPEQMKKKAPQKIVSRPTPPKVAPQPKPQVKPQQVKQPEVKPKPQPVKPAPPKPTAKPSIPPAKAPSAMKLPVPPSRNENKLTMAPSGPVSSKPTGKYTGTGTTQAPKPITASAGYGNGAGGKAPSPSGRGTGSAYSPGGGNSGNPGPGNPKGPAGVDAIREPNFGPYMSELSRRIKANWDPPRGEESKRVVLLFTIAKDGRLLNVKVVKSSGTPAADRAALAAVELTAPFRPLPAEFRGPNVDIQFTFDYNVFGAKR